MTLRHLGAGALALAMLLFVLSTPPAHAKQCVRVTPPGSFEVNPCPPGFKGRAAKQSRRSFRGHEAKRETRSRHIRVRAGGERSGIGPAVEQWDNAGRLVYSGPAVAPVRLARPGQAAGVSLVGIVAPLAAKAAEIVSACGSRIVSGVRHTFVAGTRTLSLHASGRAVDMVGHPSCIYQHLAGWPGGYTTDYGRVRHVHISHGGRENGLRFAHGGSRRHIARARITRIGR